MNAEQQKASQEDPTAKNGLAKNNLNFEEFGKMPEYVAVNRSLTDLLLSKLPRNFFHVDVAAGTGMVEKLIKEGAEETGKSGKIIGVDPNPISLAIARENVISSQSVSIKFIEGMGQDLKQLLKGEIPEEGADGVSIHDALHEIKDDKDKIQVVQSMADILKTEGLFSFNSSFTTEGNSDQGMAWGKWKAQAMKKLNRRRDPEARNKMMPTLRPEDYKQMIENTGLKVIHESRRIVTLTKEALVAIARYPAFFDGVLEDMDQKDMEGKTVEQKKEWEEVKSNALVEALADLNIPFLRRVWYEIIAQKPKAAPTLLK